MRGGIASVSARKTLFLPYRCRCSIRTRARAYIRIRDPRACPSPLKRSPSCGLGERRQRGGTKTNGCTSGTACKMLFRTTFRRFCALCIASSRYIHTEERRNVPQTPLSVDIGFPKKERSRDGDEKEAKEEAIGRFGGLILFSLSPFLYANSELTFIWPRV